MRKEASPVGEIKYWFPGPKKTVPKKRAELKTASPKTVKVWVTSPGTSNGNLNFMKETLSTTISYPAMSLMSTIGEEMLGETSLSILSRVKRESASNQKTKARPKANTKTETFLTT